MRSWMALWLVVTACGDPGLDKLAADASNAGSEGGAVPPDAQTCFGTLGLDVICFSAAPAVPVTTVSNVPINTDNVAMCDPHVIGPNKDRYCVLAGAGFTLPAGQTLRAYGGRPLVLVSTTSFDLMGTIDVSSNHGGGATDSGAGANPLTVCNGTTPATGNGGGFGGSFGGQGGDGQMKDGAGGGAAPALGGFPSELRGGCPGGNGSTSSTGSAGTGGSSGGAVAIIAVVGIHLDGTINASGAGGLGGSANRSGGGGGGSGGMIVLDAPAITPGAGGRVFANGGGGAEGGAGSTGGIASVGSPGGESTGPTVPAPGGGTGTTDGGDGGDGSAGTVTSGANATGQSRNDGGGGAGGGGAGFIRAHGLTDPNVVSPLPTGS